MARFGTVEKRFAIVFSRSTKSNVRVAHCCSLAVPVAGKRRTVNCASVIRSVGTLVLNGDTPTLPLSTRRRCWVISTARWRSGSDVVARTTPAYRHVLLNAHVNEDLHALGVDYYKRFAGVMVSSTGRMEIVDWCWRLIWWHVFMRENAPITRATNSIFLYRKEWGRIESRKSLYWGFL